MSAFGGSTVYILCSCHVTAKMPVNVTCVACTSLISYLLCREGDLESVLRHHEEVQEEVAKEMIKMAQSLKQNSLAAKNIILTDNTVSQVSC